MLLSRERFAEFAKLPIADPTTHTLALYCFSVSSRDEVDAIIAAARAADGSEADDAEDYGFMSSHSFFDLDGHGWQSCGWTRRRRSRAPRRSRPPCRTPTSRPDPPPPSPSS
jgi:predicted lactoylglutathione lyase